MRTSTLNEQLFPIYQQLSPPIAIDSGERLSEVAELEAMLGVGVLIFRNIRQRHLAWIDDVQANRIAYDISSAEGFADEYQQWQKSTEYWLALAAKLEDAGHGLGHLADVRHSYEELQLAELDVRGLTRRWQELEQGHGMEAREFFASLRK